MPNTSPYTGNRWIVCIGSSPLFPEDLRFPLVLSAIEELNSRQIGEVLGIPESSVRGRILRARQILKEKLAVRETKR